MSEWSVLGTAFAFFSHCEGNNIKAWYLHTYILTQVYRSSKTEAPDIKGNHPKTPTCVHMPAGPRLTYAVQLLRACTVWPTGEGPARPWGCCCLALAAACYHGFPFLEPNALRSK